MKAVNTQFKYIFFNSQDIKFSWINIFIESQWSLWPLACGVIIHWECNYLCETIYVIIMSIGVDTSGIVMSAQYFLTTFAVHYGAFTSVYML